MDHGPEEKDAGLKAPAGQDDAKAKSAAAPEPAAPDIPRELPILPVRNTVVFPGTVVPLQITRERSRRLINDVLSGNRILAVCAQRHAEQDDPATDAVYRVGTACQVLKLLQLPDGTANLIVHGVLRVGIEQFVATDPYWRALVNARPDDNDRSMEIEALTFNARRTAEQVIELSPNVPEEALQILRSLDEPPALADFLSANLSLGVVQKQELLETFDVGARLRKVIANLQNQLEILQLAQKIQTDVRKEIDKNQRDYFLNEQLKAIQKELGGVEGRGEEIAELRQRIEAAGMPEAVLTEALRELTRMERMPAISPETGVVRDYLETLIDLPWDESTEDHLDILNAEQVLDADHFGLAKVKRRILEFLAVRKLNPSGKSPILCFAGPPGVGKTSLGQSIARAMGRKFIRIALGGVRDEADIRGHRRTYIGSIPGRLIQELRKAKANNPVVMLDEMDKLGRDFRGDPASALLEVLDPEQNHSFTDHYLGVPFDLSHTLFIATANYMDAVEPALRDRMEVIELPGYSTLEKLEIAKRYLVPRQLERNGLKDRKLEFPDDSLRLLIDGYTREAGVRNLERNIGTVCRGLAAKVARGERITNRVQDKLIETLLGPVRFTSDMALQNARPGLATGLAYTPVGGEIIIIEATRMQGRGSFTVTGQLGDVMRESVQAAMSLLRSNAHPWGIDLTHYHQTDVHVHVPAGAVPKDGPSAGVAMLTALYTLFADTPADPLVGMTGEITLRGSVLPIGGVKEKVLGAHRAGLKTVLLPRRNEPDLADVPDSVRGDLRFILCDRVEDVLRAAVPGARLGAGKSRKGASSPKPTPAAGSRPGRARKKSKPRPAGSGSAGSSSRAARPSQKR